MTAHRQTQNRYLARMRAWAVVVMVAANSSTGIPATGMVTTDVAAPPVAVPNGAPDIQTELTSPIRVGSARVRSAVDPVADQALATEAEAFGAALGVPLQASAQVRRTELPGDVSRTLAVLLRDLRMCHDQSRHALSDQGPRRSATGALQPLDASNVEQLQSCAVQLHENAVTALPVLRQGLSASLGPDLDLWPVLRVARGHDDDVHDVDYVLLVDEGGNDLHLGNAGSNMIDVRRGHADYALRPGPARGCEQVFPDSTSGGVERGPDGERQLSSDPGPECVVSAALHIDLAGDDTYGRLETPSFPDELCTRDPVVRRIATQGVGFAGVGILIDASGNDAYLGKTLTQGAGHLGGVGVLRDLDGDDRYLAIRTAQGMGLLQGLGTLVDQAGDDDYDHYMPRPRKPRAPAQGDGAGGVNDDTGVGSEANLGQHRDEDGRLDGQPGGSCDRIARSLQGVGLLGAAGTLVDVAGADSYRAPSPETQEFLRPLDGPVAISLVHGSQGSGLFGGSGMLWDQAGIDLYRESTAASLYANRVPSSTRTNGARSLPSFQPGEDPTTGGAVDGGVFLDDE